MLALNVEEPDLTEIEQIPVELEPDIHIALVNIMGEVVEIVKAHALGMRLGNPVEFFVIGTCFIILINEIDKRSADAVDGGNIQGPVSWELLGFLLGFLVFGVAASVVLVST